VTTPSRAMLPLVVSGLVGFYVDGAWCGHCGDVNYDEETRLCLTCAYPDDPSSRAYLDARRESA
jgi:hypothetical protein